MLSMKEHNEARHWRERLEAAIPLGDEPFRQCIGEMLAHFKIKPDENGEYSWAECCIGLPPACLKILQAGLGV